MKAYMKVFLSLLIVVGPAVFLGGCASQGNGNMGNLSQSGQPQSVYAMPTGTNDIVGQVYGIKAQSGDTLDKVAQQYDMGGQEMADANPGIRANRTLSAGTKITIPAEYVLPPPQFRKGLVINIAEMRLYYFDSSNHTVLTFPVAVGRQGWDTPLGETYVYRKEEQPTWHVPKNIREAYFEKNGVEHPTEIGPGPGNPLGDYAIYLHMDGYLIHGTNQPSSVGRSVSSGCIRMYNTDVAQLFNYVKRGTPVNLIYYPNKAGWRDGQLYLESHFPPHTSPDSNTTNFGTATVAIQDALQQQPGNVNWSAVSKVTKYRTGIPAEIGVSQNG